MSSAVPAAEPVHVAIASAIAATAGGPMAARTLGEAAECVKTFPGTTLFFAGHFPGTPMVPGVILVEALAQDGGAGRRSAGAEFPAHGDQGDEVSRSGGSG